MRLVVTETQRLGLLVFFLAFVTYVLAAVR
jgi:hypothetical protein